MSRPPLLAVVCLATCCATPFAEAAATTGWSRVETPHLTVVGDAPPRAVYTLAVRLEQFRAAVALLFPQVRAASAAPTVVILFSSTPRFEPFMPVQHDGRRDHVGGLFMSGRDANYIAIAGDEEDGALRVVQHEYVHLLLSHTVADLPLWFHEGLAEYYSTFALHGGAGVEIGRPLPHHVQTLRQGQPIALPAVFESTRESPEYTDEGRRAMLYAQSWALVHYLMMDRPERRPQVARLAGELSRGVSAAEALSRACELGVAQLETELPRYARRFWFRRETIELPAGVAPAALPEPAPLEEDEVEAHLAELLVRVDRPADAIARLDRAIARFPQSAIVHLARGRVHASRQDFASAAPFLRRAIELGPDDPRVRYWDALSAYASVEGEQPSPERLRAVRDRVERALDLAPDAPDLLALAGRLDAVEPARRRVGRDRLVRAAALAPARPDIALSLADAHLHLGEHEDALRVLVPLAIGSADADVRRRASELRATVARLDHARRVAQAVRPAAAAGREHADAHDAVEAAPPVPEAPRIIPVLRAPEAGERRTEAVFEAIDCTGPRIRARFRDDSREFSLLVPRLDRVQFISYAEDALDPVGCGPRSSPERVLVTWRGGATRRTGGELVAVEFVPQGWDMGAVGGS